MIAALIIIASLFLLIFIVCGVVAGYLYNLIICPSSDKSIILLAPHNKKNSFLSKENDQNMPCKMPFKNNSQSVYIKSYDGLKLHAYALKNHALSNSWVIMCHGYSGNALRLKRAAALFYKMGLNVLAPDARGHGKSEGKYIGMGWHERLDVISWVNLIISKNKDAKIVLYGVSMGGATVAMASGENLPKNIKCIIEDCGYTSVWSELNYQFRKFLKSKFKLTSNLILNLISLETKIRAKYSFKEADALKQVKKSKTPMLFIHGSKDKFVPTFMADKLYDAATCKKEKLIIEGAAHAESYEFSPGLYEKAVKNFIEENL
ncbi:MAG: alpha/beta hydrolase [Clostridia bacterium]|nr:alpha/beta hydrolase [Clostridia bacterium]